MADELRPIDVVVRVRVVCDDEACPEDLEKEQRFACIRASDLLLGWARDGEWSGFMDETVTICRPSSPSDPEPLSENDLNALLRVGGLKHVILG